MSGGEKVLGESTRSGERLGANMTTYTNDIGILYPMQASLLTSGHRDCS